jgi:hypothetical protein
MDAAGERVGRIVGPGVGRLGQAPTELRESTWARGVQFQREARANLGKYRGIAARKKRGDGADQFLAAR